MINLFAKAAKCQPARDVDPLSASNIDPASLAFGLTSPMHSRSRASGSARDCAETSSQSQFRFRRHMAAKIEPWWWRDAGRIADVILGGMEVAQNRPAPEAPGVEEYVGQKIAEGEAAVSRPITS